MLGLLVATDPAWAELAARNLGAVLIDHAHCEMKAASNAMSLVARYGGLNELLSTEVVLRLSDLAQEEIEHFRQVVREIARRGEVLGPPPVDDYAQQLRKGARGLPWSQGPQEKVLGLADRFLVGALIEARSAERFKLLAAALDGHALHAFYTELFASEARHYRTFIDLANDVVGDAELVRERHGALYEMEAGVVRALARRGLRPAIHG